MTSPEWNPELPWMQFTGDNRETICNIMDTYLADKTRYGSNGSSHLRLLPGYEGPSLKLEMVYGDGQTRPSHTVPLNYWINTHTGEVTNEAGEVQDWADLAEMP